MKDINKLIERLPKIVSIMERQNDILKDLDIINLFSNYISSNDNFKYNETYLTDQKKDYIDALIKFNEKIKFYKTLKVNCILDSFIDDWIIIFDGLFAYSNVNPMDIQYLDNDYINQFNNKDIRGKLPSIKCFSLRELNNNNITITLIKKECDEVYEFKIIEKQKIENKIKLFYAVPEKEKQ